MMVTPVLFWQRWFGSQNLTPPIPVYGRKKVSALSMPPNSSAVLWATWLDRNDQMILREPFLWWSPLPPFISDDGVKRRIESYPVLRRYHGKSIRIGSFSSPPCLPSCPIERSKPHTDLFYWIAQDAPQLIAHPATSLHFRLNTVGRGVLQKLGGIV